MLGVAPWLSLRNMASGEHGELGERQAPKYAAVEVFFAAAIGR